MCKFLIAGDLVINQDLLVQVDPTLINLFQDADINIVNLEAPVTNSELKILKTGPTHKSNTESSVAILKLLKINAVTLANNHILDYGSQGLTDTINFCKENGVLTVGAGKDITTASKTLYVDCSGLRFAIINFAENEWASASENSAGANPMDIIENTKQIKSAKDKADFVFVIIHGGHEYYNLPSPRIQKQYRFYAEQGADLVVSHHTHCIGGYEVYKGVPIYYGLGNFLFTKNSLSEDWYTGLVLQVEITGKLLNTKLYPVRQSKQDYNLSFLDFKDKDKLLNQINDLNEIIISQEALRKEWLNYVESKSLHYLSAWSPKSFIKSRYIKFILNKLRIKMINKVGLSLYLNLMRCEAHNDLSKEIITRYLKNETSHTS